MTQPTGIPEVFVKRLESLGSCFIRVAGRGKNPIDHGWNHLENMMSVDDPRLREHLANGGNYGVVGGCGLAVLDADTAEVKDLVESRLPSTLTVCTGSGGHHYYFLCSLEKPIRLRDKNKTNMGDIQGPGKMVVGPGSTHPNGQRYEIINDAPLARVTREQLVEALGEYVVSDREENARIDDAARQERTQFNIDFDIMGVAPPGLKKSGDEYFGPHPVHGSRTGTNFWVNPSKGVWHCFRCGTGGGAWSLLAVMERIIDCTEALPGALQGDKFKQVLAKAKERGLTGRDLISEPLVESSPLSLRVETLNPLRQFTANASLGPEAPASGFIMFEDKEWIAVEATYLYGILREVKDGKTFQTESLQPVFFYNQTGTRGSMLSKDSVLKLGDKALRPSSKTLGSSGPQTLMTLEVGHRFLKGETVVVEDLYSPAMAGLKRFSNLNWNCRLYDVTCCIVIASYFYDLFGAFPIIIVMGPFESGKTRLLLSIVYMGHRGMPVLDPSEASIFRTAEAWKGFLGIDEFWKVRREIERLLRASYKRGMKVPRIDKTKGGLMILSLFDLFGKVVIASPEPFPPNILSKGIQFQLRKMPDPNPEKRDPEPRDFEEFRARAYIARLTWAPEVKAYADRLDKQDLGLSGRDYEVWKPALTIASMIGGEVWANVLAFAKESCEEKRRESYEELKEVIEGIYSLIKDRNGSFPLTFTPKQIHDIIWERLKDNYRVTKERQEVQGEVGEKYDYDTRKFEEIYRVHKIGRTYLQQLGLKGRRKERGTQYEIHSAEDFHGFVIRYHPDLPSQEHDYANLVLTSKLMPELPEMPAKADLRVERHGSEAAISRPTGNNNASHEENVSLPSSETTLKEQLTGNTVNTCITSSSLRPHSATLKPSIPEQLQPPFIEVGPCAICRAHSPLRPNLEETWLICQKCFEKQSERDSK